MCIIGAQCKYVDWLGSVWTHTWLSASHRIHTKPVYVNIVLTCKAPHYCVCTCTYCTYKKVCYQECVLCHFVQEVVAGKWLPCNKNKQTKYLKTTACRLADRNTSVLTQCLQKLVHDDVMDTTADVFRCRVLYLIVVSACVYVFRCSVYLIVV